MAQDDANVNRPIVTVEQNSNSQQQYKVDLEGEKKDSKGNNVNKMAQDDANDNRLIVTTKQNTNIQQQYKVDLEGEKTSSKGNNVNKMPNMMQMIIGLF